MSSGAYVQYSLVLLPCVISTLLLLGITQTLGKVGHLCLALAAWWVQVVQGFVCLLGFGSSGGGVNGRVGELACCQLCPEVVRGGQHMLLLDHCRECTHRRRAMETRLCGPLAAVDDGIEAVSPLCHLHAARICSFSHAPPSCGVRQARQKASPPSTYGMTRLLHELQSIS